MNKTNSFWLSALCRFLLALALLAPTSAQADVSGEGDITPSTDVDDEGEPLLDFQGNPITLPDLPVEGGDLPGGDLVVGGTGERVGNTDFGRMTISNPLFTNPLTVSTATLGMNERGVGEVTVSGFTSELLIRGGDLKVGDAGKGVLEISGGGLVTTAPMLDMEGMPGMAIIGEDFSSRGNRVSVSGSASLLDVGDFVIAEHGQATLEVTNEGTVRSVNTEIGAGRNSNGIARFSGGGVRWINTEDVEIGTAAGSAVDQNGTGRLEILLEATVSIGAADSASPGSTQFISGQTNVNELGTVELGGGSLNTYELNNGGLIRGFGSVRATESFVVGPRGTISNAGNSFVGRERLYVENFSDPSNDLINNGTIESLGGEMTFRPTVENNLEIIARDAIMRFPGGLSNESSGSISIGGDTEIHGNIVDNGGGIFVLSGSESQIVGDLTFTGGSILGLTIGDAAGTLDILGAVSFDSTLIELNFSAGNAPSEGDMYQILQANEGISGTFSPTAILDGDLWDITSTGSALFATFSSVPPLLVGADFNGDGIVDALDMTIWRSNYPIAGGASKSMGDADGDGDVDGADLFKIQRSFGIVPVPPISASTAVPEPSTLALALLMTACCLGRRPKS